MAFLLYAHLDADESIAVFEQGSFSESLRLADVTSREPGMRFAAVINETRHTLAAFSRGELLNVMTLEEEYWVEQGKCRRASEGCPGANGKMGYCSDHFGDLVIDGEPGRLAVREPESLAATEALLDRLANPKPGYAKLALGYELLHDNPDITGPELASRFDVTNPTIYRWFPDLWRPRRLSEEKKERGRQLFLRDPRITKTEMARRLDVNITTVTNHLPFVRDGRFSSAFSPARPRTSFSLYIKKEHQDQPARVLTDRFSEALRIGELASTGPDVKYAAIVNESGHTLAVFCYGRAIDWLSEQEEAALNSGKCRLTSDRCSSDRSAMGYCSSHFRDIVIDGDAGDPIWKPPEQFGNPYSIAKPRLGRPTYDAVISQGFEMLSADDTLTPAQLSQALCISNLTVRRRLGFPMSKRKTDKTVDTTGDSTRAARQKGRRTGNAARLGQEDFGAPPLSGKSTPTQKSQPKTASSGHPTSQRGKPKPRR